VDDTKLWRAAVIAQIVLLILSVARIQADVGAGHGLGIEGRLALALALSSSMALVKAAICRGS
jgi:hypothetical protein